MSNILNTRMCIKCNKPYNPNKYIACPKCERWTQKELDEAEREAKKTKKILNWGE